MPRRKLQVARDHVQRLIGTSPIKAVQELIWNALDAGGTRVDVKLRISDLGVVERLEVIDRGPGIRPDDLDRAFGEIGHSLKPERKINSDGRAYHGREGKGRLKALSLSPVATWETIYKDGDALKSYQITIDRDAPDYFEPTDPKPAASRSTGTRVILDDLDKGQLLLAKEDIHEKLAEVFAAYLMSYPGVTLVWDGRPIQIDDLIAHRDAVELITRDRPGGPATLLIIEWKFKPESKRIHLCDERGFSYHDIPAEVPAKGIEYTAYVRTPAAPGWSDTGRLVAEGLDDEVQQVLGLARDQLRDYVRSRQAEEAQSVVQEWKDQNIYPYEPGESLTPLARAEREVFDIVAVQVNQQHPSFSRTDRQSKQLTLTLIKQAVESNPSDLTRILREVINLSEDDQRAFRELLERAPLSNLIRAGKMVADRLDTILTFEHILFDPDWKRRLLERTQLHRLLVHEIWILGEEYSVGGDDEGLKDVLSKHLKLMGRNELAPEVDVALIDGKHGIPDLMLYRRRKVDRDSFEHLVVELKRPRDLLGQEEATQIEKYAFTVARDERFNTAKCSWEFVLLGNDLDDYVVEKTSSPKLPEGCLHEGKGVRIWVRRWADVLNDARARYEFFRHQLEYEASHTRGLEAMKSRYPHLFDGRGARKGKDLTLSDGAGRRSQ